MMVPVSDIENKSMKSDKKWILYGSLGNADGNKSGEFSSIQKTTQSNVEACLLSNLGCGHAALH